MTMARTLKMLTLGVSSLAMIGCASTTLPGSQDKNQQAASDLGDKLGVIPGGMAPEDMDPISKAAYWGTRYDRAPGDADTAIHYSKALRDMGNNEEALKVMTRFAGNNEAAPGVKLEYGKTLIANDRSFEAVRPLQQAIAQMDSWHAYSAYGVALDQIGEHGEARRQYQTALQRSPDNASVMNNLGLSLALSGNLSEAELTLRKAAIAKDGTARIRQNLALVLAFAGKASEAERLARSDLPPRIADNNAAYYSSLVSRPAYWQEFTGDNVEMPDFGAAPVNPPRAAKMTPVMEGDLPAPVATPAPAATTPREPAPAASTAPQPLRPQPQPAPAEPETDSEDVLSALEDEQAKG